MWRDALVHALEKGRFGSIKQGMALRELAAQLVQKGLEGDITALRELADRLDGRPAQSVTIAGDEDAAPVSLRISAPK